MLYAIFKKMKHGRRALHFHYLELVAERRDSTSDQSEKRKDWRSLNKTSKQDSNSSRHPDAHHLGIEILHLGWHEGADDVRNETDETELTVGNAIL